MRKVAKRVGNSTKLFIMAVAVSAGTGYAALAHVHGASAATTSTASVSVDPAQTSYHVPQRFMGFSMEPANTCSLVNIAKQKPAMKQLFANLGKTTLRVGGNTVEYTSWQPDATATCKWDKTVVTKKLVDNVFNFANSVGWTVSWTVPLKHFNPSQAIPEASYVASKGSSVWSIEFGNEPDQYGITYSQYLQDWKAYYADFHPSHPSTPIDGPAVASLTGSYYSSFLNDAGSDVSFATGHKYMGGAGGTNPSTISDLLSPQTAAGERQRIGDAYQLAKSHGKMLTINEAGSYWGYGQPGVSDVYASALWASDYLFNALEVGAHGLDFHGVPDTPVGNSNGQIEYYAPIYQDATPAPMYYGMLLYRYVTHDGGYVVPVHLSTSANLTAHAVTNHLGQTKIVLINKSSTTSVTTTLDTTKPYKSASYIVLRAPSLSSKSGITLGAASVGSNGSWAPTYTHTLPVSGSKSTVTVPAGQAVVITYQ